MVPSDMPRPGRPLLALVVCAARVAAAASLPLLDPPCTTTPQPCSAHSNRTFCQGDPSPHQCSAAKPRSGPCPACPKPAHPTGDCKTEEDCSLGGECVAGKCKCDAVSAGAPR